MNILDIINTANGNLFRSKLRTILTLLAVIVGAFTLTLTLGIGEGTKNYIDQQTKTFTVENSLIVQAKQGPGSNPISSISSVEEYNPNKGQFGINFLKSEDRKKVEALNNVEKTYPLYNLNPEYITGTKTDKKYQVRISPLFDALKPALIAGNLPSETDKDSMVIAKKYVQPLGFDNVRDILGQKVKIAVKNPLGRIKEYELTVTGVLVETIVAGGASYVQSSVVDDMHSFQANNNPEFQDQLFGFYAVMPKNLTQSQQLEVKKSIDTAGYKATTIEEEIASIKSFITILQTSLSVFGAIAILAATFGIVNTLLMGVYERTREIGLMKALGMKSGGIFSMFALEALSIGFWGGLIGILLGILVGSVVSNVAKNSFLKGFEGFTLLVFPPTSLIWIVIGTMTVGLLAGTLPALKAARLNPIDALRYE